MSDDPSGVYSLPPGYLVATNDDILPSQHNPPLEDLAQSMTLRLCKDGRSAMTGNLQMNNNKITGLATATAGTDGLSRDAGDARYIQRPSLVRTVTSVSSAADRTLTVADLGKLIVLGGSIDFTLTVDPAAALGNGWSVNLRSDGRCIVTIDPNAAETVDGATTLPFLYRQQGTLICTGAAFRTFGIQKILVLDSVDQANVANVDFKLPPGYRNFNLNASFAAVAGSTDVYLRTSNNDGVTFAAGATDYGFNFNVPGGPTAISSSYGGSAGQMWLWSVADNATVNGRRQAVEVKISNARDAATYTSMTSMGCGAQIGFTRGHQIWSGERFALESNDAIRILGATQNISITATLIGIQA